MGLGKSTKLYPKGYAAKALRLATVGGGSTFRRGYGTDWYAVSASVVARDAKCLTPGCGNTAHLHSHHIVRATKGGSNSKANLITLCEECHSKRHNGKDVSVKRKPQS